MIMTSQSLKSNIFLLKLLVVHKDFFPYKLNETVILGTRRYHHIIVHDRQLTIRQLNTVFGSFYGPCNIWTRWGKNILGGVESAVPYGRLEGNQSVVCSAGQARDRLFCLISGNVATAEERRGTVSGAGTKLLLLVWVLKSCTGYMSTSVTLV
jgi:hypothetical protein